MPAGRPTKYRKRYAKNMLEFFRKEAFEQQRVAEDTAREKLQLVPTRFPTFGFADSINVTVQTLIGVAQRHNWQIVSEYVDHGISG
jgi:hypothetical protein